VLIAVALHLVILALWVYCAVLLSRAKTERNSLPRTLIKHSALFVTCNVGSIALITLALFRSPDAGMNKSIHSVLNLALHVGFLLYVMWFMLFYGAPVGQWLLSTKTEQRRHLGDLPALGMRHSKRLIVCYLCIAGLLLFMAFVSACGMLSHSGG
jgi:hypothetical protein